jgi:hypothetical protein
MEESIFIAVVSVSCLRVSRKSLRVSEEEAGAMPQGPVIM